MKTKKYDFYPFNHESLAAVDGQFALTKMNRAWYNHYCGYFVIENALIPKEWQGNYDADGLQYLAVHGGLTYCDSNEEFTVFGFDCAHAGDESNLLLQDPGHVMSLTVDMGNLITAYSKRIEEWRGSNREGRANIIDEINATAKNKVSMGFGAMLGMLAGCKELGEE